MRWRGGSRDPAGPLEGRADEPFEPSTVPGVSVPGDPTLPREDFENRFDLKDRTLREHSTRGVIINSAFQVGFASLGLLQRVAVAAFLTAAEFGFWGIVLTIVMTLAWLKQVGISDKYIQQDEADQELAFQKAFTLELAYTSVFYVLLLAALPAFALIYDRPEILLPAFVLSLALPIGVFGTPIWVTYRRMRFVRQRVIEGVNPVVGTTVTIALAVTGAGYWSLVWGVLAGAVAGAIVAMATSPYPLALRYDRGTFSEYFSFSWPLLLSGAASLVVVQGTLIVGNFSVGLAGLGAIALAASFTEFADRVDAIVMRTIYPAICAVKDRRDVLFEAFTKSNRIALIWGLPFGVGLFLFASDLVDLLGERWEPAEPLLQVLGLIVGIRQIGFNWGGFLTATGNTRPLAVMAGVLLFAFAAVTAPLMFFYGLDGYLIGVAVSLVAELCVRGWYLSKLFEGFNLLRHAYRAVLPSVPAVLVVLAIRESVGGQDPGVVIAELVAYVIVTVAATAILERRLLAEIVGYARGKRDVLGGVTETGAPA